MLAKISNPFTFEIRAAFDWVFAILFDAHRSAQFLMGAGHEQEAADVVREAFTKAFRYNEDRIGLAAGKMLNSIGPVHTEKFSDRQSALPPGEWLLPSRSIASLANMMGNITPEAAKSLLEPFGLRNFPAGNRQRWTVNLASMPQTLRDQLDPRRKNSPRLA